MNQLEAANHLHREAYRNRTLGIMARADLFNRAEIISKHYLKHANNAQQLQMFLKTIRFKKPTQLEHDFVTRRLNEILDSHLDDFGIELNWEDAK
jgi:hypothetical protein